MSRGNAYRDGKVHVCKAMCSTCIFHEGNRMNLRDGRVEDMVEIATKSESAIICHATLDGDNAVCRGFFDQHKTSTLQIAERMGIVEFDK